MSAATKREAFHTATPCDRCGGPTLQLSSGSIWCSAEDAHPGGHFVVRVAFERSPLKAVATAPAPARVRAIRPPATVVARPKSDTDGFDLGMDDFIGGK